LSARCPDHVALSRRFGARFVQIKIYFGKFVKLFMNNKKIEMLTWGIEKMGITCKDEFRINASLNQVNSKLDYLQH
jgi:hypothetical protein